jgi:hypothetical protein
MDYFETLIEDNFTAETRRAQRKKVEIKEKTKIIPPQSRKERKECREKKGEMRILIPFAKHVLSAIGKSSSL